MLLILKQNILNTSSKTLLASLEENSDALLLIQDGVYLTQYPEIIVNCPCYVLIEDMNARGLKYDKQKHKNVQAINYDSFVQLCTQYERITTW